MWWATHHSGVHATIAGVVLALLTPVGRFRGRAVADLLQQRLHPLTAFAIVPIFALANAGVDLRGDVLAEAAVSRVSWAIALGLVAGKTFGIALCTFAMLRGRLGTLPAGMPASQVWGVSALAGIGFTVSLFITDLAYASPLLTDQAKIGIFVGSLTAGALGVTLLVSAGRRRPPVSEASPAAADGQAGMVAAASGAPGPAVGHRRDFRPGVRPGARRPQRAGRYRFTRQGPAARRPK
jgi:NhaA family Na+:H+ antiporter